KRELDFRTGRTAFDGMPQLLEPLLDPLRFKQRNSSIEFIWIQIEQEWQCDVLEVCDPLWCFQGRTGQDADAPWLTMKSFDEFRRELLKLVDVFGLAKKREC